MTIMANKRKTTDKAKKSFPSRATYKATYLPKPLHERLKVIADKQERSVAFLVHRAVKEYLERHKDELGE